MPDLDQFMVVASTMAARTCFLSGDTSALLFSSLGAINAFWQWTKPGGVSSSDWDEIQALIDKAATQLMTPNIGQIIAYVTADPPLYVIPCDGEIYDRVDYPSLYAVLDAAYVVDADTFRTPALNGRSPMGSGTSSFGTTYSAGENAGEEYHELTEDENGSHSHSDTGHFHSYQPPGISGLALAPGELPVALPNIIPSVTGTSYAAITSSGSGEGHNTVHPVHVVKFGVIFQ